MTRIVAYVFDADVHCPGCARERFSFGITLKRPNGSTYEAGASDDHGVGVDAEDHDGNRLYRIRTTDEVTLTHFTHCGTCRDPLKERT